MSEVDECEVDKRLLAKISAGNSEALAQLYDRHAPKVLRIIHNILRNRQDAEDLLHDVFVESWEKASAYTPERGSVLSWLMIRARSRAIDRLRVGELRKRYVDSTMRLEECFEQDEVLESINNKRLIGTAFKQLSRLQRETLVLCYFQGLSYEEIARHNAVPMGTVKSRLSSAIRKLSQHFASVGELEL